MRFEPGITRPASKALKCFTAKSESKSSSGERNHRERTGSATYSKNDYERIAHAIGRSTADVLQHTNEFEAAATWYRINIPPAERDGASTSEQRKQRPKKPKTPSERRKQRSKKPKTLSQLRKKANQIEAAAKKLLRHLGVHHFREAADGPGDRDLLIFLASYGAASEEEVTQATAQIGRLAELSGAITATKFLEVCAAEAAQEAINFGRLIPEGHLGDLPENEWVAAMMSLYEKITGRKARTSIIAPGRPRRGKASGPLIRFLAAAGAPFGIKHSPKSWRGRIRDNQTGGRRRK